MGRQLRRWRADAQSSLLIVLMVLHAPDEIGVLSLERIRSPIEGQVHFLYRPSRSHLLTTAMLAAWL
jgi:hypothetical protein